MKSLSLPFTFPFFLFGMKVGCLETQRHFVALRMEAIMLKIVEQPEVGAAVPDDFVALLQSTLH